MAKWFESLFSFLSGAYEEHKLNGTGAQPLGSVSLPISVTGYSVKQIKLIRDESSDQGTFGTIDFDGFRYETIELPWRGNQPMISCVMPGKYHCVWEMSPSKGHETYRLVNVPGRTGVLIHSGNFAGDISRGLKSDFLGCIGLGIMRGNLDGQKAIISSRAAVAKFENALKREPFDLEIIGEQI